MLALMTLERSVESSTELSGKAQLGEIQSPLLKTIHQLSNFLRNLLNLHLECRTTGV